MMKLKPKIEINIADIGLVGYGHIKILLIFGKAGGAKLFNAAKNIFHIKSQRQVFERSYAVAPKCLIKTAGTQVFVIDGSNVTEVGGIGNARILRC
jgi:hypothetical protein